MHPITRLMAPAALLAAAPLASAQLISFTYSDLEGNFDSASSSFTVEAAAGTAGDVTRLIPNMNTADFAVGDFDATLADVSMTLTVAAPAGSTAAAFGSLTLTDADGDTITADVSGSFIGTGGFVFFNGFLANALVNDVSMDDTFDGSSGAFSTDFSDFVSPFSGATVQLFMQPGNFFEDDFTNESIELSGLLESTLVPAPSAALAACAAGLTLTGRRRKNA